MHTILGVERDPTGMLIGVKHAPGQVTDQDILHRVSLPPQDWTLIQAVKLYGENLLNALRTAHPGVNEVFNQLKAALTAQSQELYFKFGNALADQQYWETLNDNNQFISLRQNPEIQIGRIPDATQGTGGGTRSIYPKVLCIMAYLSALGLTAQSEWDSLFSAVSNAIAKGLNIKLVVRVGEPGLLQAIQSQIHQQGLNFVDVALIPQFAVEVEDDLKKHRPHILHLYCHGAVQGSQKFLSLATFANWLDHSQGNPLSTKPLTLISDNLKSAGLWLIVLNCCQGARAAGSACSLAYDLVAKHEIPAVIGNLDDVPLTNASILSNRLYAEIADLLANWHGNGNSEITFVWPRVLASVRRQLASQHNLPDEERSWSIPVVYVRNVDFVVQRGGIITAEMFKKLQLVSDTLRANPEMPEALKRQIQETILNGIPMEHWPDLQGNFAVPAS